MIDKIHSAMSKKIKVGNTIEASGYDLLLRLFSYLLMVSWVAFFPIYLLVIHMKVEKFFSYDIFIDGVLGIKSFIMIIVVLITVSSLMLWGFIIFFSAAKIKKSRELKVLGYIFVFVSLAVHLSFFLSALGPGKLERLAWLSGLGLIFILSAVSYLKNPLQNIVANWALPLICIGLSAAAPIIFSATASDIVKTGLENFKVGGGVPAIIYKTDDSKVIATGKLLLLTPSYIYLRTKQTGYTTISRSSDTYIEVK